MGVEHWGRVEEGGGVKIAHLEKTAFISSPCNILQQTRNWWDRPEDNTEKMRGTDLCHGSHISIKKNLFVDIDDAIIQHFKKKITI